MAQRTTLILDDEARAAARQLALKYDCSTSAAIRKAIVRHRDAVLGVSPKARRQRRQILRRMFQLFSDNDPDAEVRRLKAEDAGF